MTRRRKAVFALLAMGLAVVVSLGVLLVADMYAHRKFQDSGGVNIWGYRGPTAGRKRPGERRIVVLGESAAFGYGVQSKEAFPAVLERLLNQREGGAASPPKVSVVNLAYNAAGAHSFRYTLADYAYLDYDVALFYTGYGDLAYSPHFETTNLAVFRRGSWLFRWTGYFPMLPTVMREKAMVIRYNGRLEDAYLGKPTVFRPNFAQRSTASALEAAYQISETLDRHMAEAKRSDNEVRDGKPVLADTEAVACGQYTGYCGELYLAVKFVLDRGKRALVVTQPYTSERHKEQQFLMTEYLRKRFADPTQLRFINVGPLVDHLDPTMAFDGMHLTVAGHLVVAKAMVEGIRASLSARPEAPTDPSVSRSPAPAAAPSVLPAEPTRAVRGLPSPAPPGPGTVRMSPGDGRPMAWIPPGTFQMGSPTSEANRDAGEIPHQVTVGSGFWMDTNEVTNAAYQRFIQQQSAWQTSVLDVQTYVGEYLRGWKEAQPPAGKDDHPVTTVMWVAASAYCTWAGKRLPTEAEWEYAVRAGRTTAYWWGETFDGTRANKNGHGTEPVGQAPRVNPWGLADMAGNVWEWTSSWYQPYPYRPDDGRENPEAGGKGRRVLRGGAWVIGPGHLRSADRFRYNPRIASDYVGFRCAQSGS